MGGHAITPPKALRPLRSLCQSRCELPQARCRPSCHHCHNGHAFDNNALDEADRRDFHSTSPFDSTTLVEASCRCFGFAVTLSPPNGPLPPFHCALSSPPPDIEHELEACLTSFGRSKALADNIINIAIERLSTLGYTPDVLADTDISNERIGEVSGLLEGTVSALRRFAREWCGRVAAKRARIDRAEA